MNINTQQKSITKKKEINTEINNNNSESDSESQYTSDYSQSLTDVSEFEYSDDSQDPDWLPSA